MTDKLMTRTEARKRIKALGTIVLRTDDGEHRVNFRGGKEETAYYTNDLRDAVQTAEAMVAKQKTERAEWPLMQKDATA